MPILDEKGRLFGLVNVVDALVVLFVAVLVIGGVFVVMAPDPQPEPAVEPGQRTAVLDLGNQPVYLASAIEVGDTYAAGPNSNLTITGVYVSPARIGQPSGAFGRARVLLAVRLEGVSSPGNVNYAGEPIRLGRDLAIRASGYQVSGTIRDIGTGLDSTRTPVLINATVDRATAEAVSVGDDYTVAGREVATVESATAFATKDPDRLELFVGVSLATVSTTAGPWIGESTLAKRDSVAFRTDAYELRGQVRRVGTSDLPGEPTTRSVTLVVEDVPPGIAEHVRPGSTETVLGRTVAEVTAVRSEPAETRLVTNGTHVTVGPHPENVDLRVTADLALREAGSRVTFKGRTVQPGSVVVLGLEDVTVEARVVEL